MTINQKASLRFVILIADFLWVYNGLWLNMSLYHIQDLNNEEIRKLIKMPTAVYRHK